MIDGTKLPAGTVVFTHIDDVDGIETTYSITHIKRAIIAAQQAKTLQVGRVHVDHKFAKWCKTHRGIEKHRLDRIKTRDLKIPVIFAMHEDKSTGLLIDGHHRYVKASGKMMRTLPAFLLPPSIWTECIVTGLDSVHAHKLINSYSGIA